MSIIATFINSYGIVFASDSNLSNDRGNAGFGQKLFPIPNFNACIAYTGAYSINNQEIDQVLNEFVIGQSHICSTIHEVVLELTSILNREMNDIEFSIPTIIHVAGYQNQGNVCSVEHWHISNTGLNDDGTYQPARDEFIFHNDFDSYNNPANRNLIIQMENSSQIYQFFINGYPPGRISIMILMESINQSIHRILSNGNWNFRAPKNLFEFASQIKLSFYVVCELFKMSDYNALYVGGEIQTYLLPKPQNIDTSPLS